MSVTSKRSLHSRRSIIAAATGLAASALAGNRATALSGDSDLPDAATQLVPIAPVAPPVLNFTDEKGHKLSLAAYTGHVLLVNLWATWCGPCVDELPTLAVLARRIEPFGGLVLPISIDIGGAATVSPFYALHGIENVPILLNPSGDDLEALNTNGVPVTLVIDPRGRLVARLDGAADWDTPNVLAYLKSLAPAQHPTKPAHVTAL